jgi:hypothetical protein
MSKLAPNVQKSAVPFRGKKPPKNRSSSTGARLDAEPFGVTALKSCSATTKFVAEMKPNRLPRIDQGLSRTCVTSGGCDNH